MLTAIIVAAGSSERMGFDKLFALVSGKPVIAHTIDAFEHTDCIDEIILVGRAESLDELRKIIAQPTKVKEIIAGGAERSDSVRAGLDHINPKADFVAVHDAARPLVTPEKITRVFEACRTSGGAATLAEPINDTLKRADLAAVAASAKEVVDLVIAESVDRSPDDAAGRLGVGDVARNGQHIRRDAGRYAPGIGDDAIASAQEPFDQPCPDSLRSARDHDNLWLCAHAALL